MKKPPWGYPAWLVGVDEVGTGALAGPFYICAFAAEVRQWKAPAGLTDSKELTWTQKANLYRELVGENPEPFNWGNWRPKPPSPESVCIARDGVGGPWKGVFSIISVPHQEIDRIGLRRAWLAGVKAAVIPIMDALYQGGIAGPKSEAKVVIDGNVTHPDFRGGWAFALPKADKTVPVVSAASIIAKVNRDMFMQKLHKQFPAYGWSVNMGYGTKTHLRALQTHGATQFHRRSAAPVQRVLPVEERRTSEQILLTNTEIDIIGHD